MRQPFLETQRDSSLPRLGWWAELELESGRCLVTHGAEALVDPSPTPRWVAACIWDGPLDEGGFHHAEHVFGSGVRLEGDSVHFVPASTTIERLLHVRVGKRLLVSNSLVVLLARLGAELGPRSHDALGEGSCHGIHEYLRDVPVIHPLHEAIQQTLYSSLVVNGEEERFAFRHRAHEFASYGDYRAQLRGVMQALLANACSPSRPGRTRLVTSTSRGYDSPAVTALVTELAQEMGVPVASYSSPRSNSRIPAFLMPMMGVDVHDDDGRDIARQLGAEPRSLARDPRSIPADLEAWMWAAAPISPELVMWPLLADAGEQEGLTVCFSGYFGDGMWDTHPDPRALQGTLYRGAPSGYGLAEARQVTGVIDCSPPYIFGTSLANLHRVTMSAELAPWRLGNDYDRPIPRRVLEERGVTREAFGHGKKAIAQDLDVPQGSALREAFFRDTHWSEALERSYELVNRGVYFASRGMAFLRSRGSRAQMLGDAPLTRGPLPDLTPALDLRRQTFEYCVARLTRTLRRE